MSEFTTNWTKEELGIYILIYCANANFVESKGETDFIQSKTDKTIFAKVHGEFHSDNDYQSIQKIRSALESFGYSKDEKDTLMEEIKSLFLSDGKYDTLEKNLFLGLNQIFGV